jgi:hypothetical protein
MQAVRIVIEVLAAGWMQFHDGLAEPTAFEVYQIPHETISSSIQRLTAQSMQRRARSPGCVIGFRVALQGGGVRYGLFLLSGLSEDCNADELAHLREHRGLVIDLDFRDGLFRRGEHLQAAAEQIIRFAGVDGFTKSGQLSGTHNLETLWQH